MKIEDDILQQINRDMVVGFTKDDSQERFKALYKLRAFGLVYEQPKYHWRLTEKGYKAADIGFDIWLKDHEKPTPVIAAENFTLITGDKNKVIQSTDREFKSKYTKHKPDTINKIATFIGIILTIIGLIISYLQLIKS